MSSHRAECPLTARSRRSDPARNAEHSEAGRGINETLYSLDGPAQGSESFSLVADASEWSVLYKERGEFQKLGSGLSESEACGLIYESLDQALNLSRMLAQLAALDRRA